MVFCASIVAGLTVNIFNRVSLNSSQYCQTYVSGSRDKADRDRLANYEWEHQFDPLHIRRGPRQHASLVDRHQRD